MSSLINNYARYDVSFVRGEGIYLYDDKGAQYIDFGSGISVTNLGHCNPHVVSAIKAQADKLWHTSNIFTNNLQTQLAQRISEAAFGEIFFCNSGAEANEAAIKLARIHNNNVFAGGKNRIVTMVNGFHGRTFMTMSATGQDKIQKGFQPMNPGFTYIPYNDLEALEAELIKGDVGAVMMELFQGESGVIPASDDYVRGVRKLTKECGALMIIDEVQTGFGRTGKLFAYQHIDIEPDIITMAKAIANGLPMGAVAAQPFISAYFTPGTHGSTFGGGYLACAASHAVLDVMLADGFLEKVAEKGEQFQRMLADVFNPKGAVVRGKGMLVGVEMPFDNKEFIKACLKEHLVLIAGGSKAVRFYPPLTATMEELAKGVAIAAKVMNTF